MLSTDRKILEAGSASSLRMIEYGKVLGDLQVVVFAKDKHHKILSPEVTVHSTNSIFRFLYIFDACRLIIKLNKLKKVDWLSAQDPFETGLIAWLANIFIKTNIQFQIHTDAFNPFFVKSSLSNRCRVFLAKFLLPKATRIRVVSQKIYDSLVVYLPNLSPEKITILPVLIDRAEFTSRKLSVDLRQKYPQFNKIVLMASRFEPEKDFGTAIRAFKQIVSKQPKAGLVIVGEGSEKKSMEKLIKNLGLTGHVAIEPWTNELFSYFKTADVYLLSSLFEGYGRTLVEACLAGIPFVSTEVGCARELVDLGLKGAVVAVGDRQGMSQALSRLLENNHDNRDFEEIKLPDSIHFLPKEIFLKKYQALFI